MANVTWEPLPRGTERAEVNHYQCDVWRVGGGARVSVWSHDSRCYIAGGKLDSVDAAKAYAVTAALNPEDFAE